VRSNASNVGRLLDHAHQLRVPLRIAVDQARVFFAEETAHAAEAHLLACRAYGVGQRRASSCGTRIR